VTEEQALVRWILTDPADDLPRLVYADWLDENAKLLSPCPHCGGGRPGEWMYAVNRDGECATCDGALFQSDGRGKRAAAIRAMVHLVATFADPEPFDFVARWGTHDPHYLAACEWLCGGLSDAALMGVVGGHCRGVEGAYVWNRDASDGDEWGLRVMWERGFVARVECDLATWERHGAALVAAFPLEEVRLTADHLYRHGHYLDGVPYCAIEPNHLPGDVWDAIHRGDNYSTRYELWSYPDYESARTALGLAFLNVERRRLSLPPVLPVPTAPAGSLL
jgi:uncharacterized protein (TIGR02996 family)